ncbi:MAG: hypothetical protein IH944_02755 [Armatimonadetes bacterium]|nr:hypothetical protein [Armatimonadota bacterium]
MFILTILGFSSILCTQQWSQSAEVSTYGPSTLFGLQSESSESWPELWEVEFKVSLDGEGDVEQRSVALGDATMYVREGDDSVDFVLSKDGDTLSELHVASTWSWIPGLEGVKEISGLTTILDDEKERIVAGQACYLQVWELKASDIVVKIYEYIPIDDTLRKRFKILKHMEFRVIDDVEWFTQGYEVTSISELALIKH